ncbi:MAG: hypothetical protein A2268_10215 [Candidatus Raymondbacteria bacterium RifOxyA12_full_50_37]|uniref:Secretion system C-terminal sorting domain-containing protein n=1 Tax=Candidatus Raymondbacteria bacterium RIFOXYD12_FULL_49_13 TaxID=1817890 RepID=A0A1F7F2Y1_UNCRA|nr:MAG: hypothetical protein A2350_07535 [Candidatus Raymondbacteria bacterium RifOxyB12_full_50_8]OGJ91540.1 MAG: hypothetical protein A2268_10215 [Candidatus Raymondbacteria bacterium RifOxyA12_full_50_37]OGJ94402.1 MAG: hypothetical protein A2248_07030 [Candidatus Raymondbacteria bacterium RIFOXYA2_FULL_49_16]OGJ95116.1 MAG: hypothetical protein A2453_00185 [Candidatus Raymondbacteria bacterium RIFOXYC2_FULL_50_21]OGJ97204.1 MAG: hypothetical protein A2487_16610 [Candidatus Raymondbacteria b
MKLFYLIPLFLSILMPVFAAVPSNLAVSFRSGQVFLTWDEVASGEKYIMYRSTSPITVADLTLENKRFEVAQGFAHNDILDHLSQISTFSNLTPPCVFSRNVTEPLDPAATGNTEQLPEGKNMIVLTTHINGTYYYAVTAVIGGIEDKSVDGGNSIGPVAETVADPAPLLIWQSNYKTARIYLQYIDVDTFNLSYRYQEYAFPYWVGVNRRYNSTLGGCNLELCLNGGTQDLGGITDSIPDNMANKHIDIKVIPEGDNTYWFGFSQTYNYRLGDVVDTGPTMNFTQARVMNFLKYLIFKDAYFSARIDTNRVFLKGNSNGSGGTLQFAYNYPDFFAYAFSYSGATDYYDEGVYDKRGYFSKLWGAYDDTAMTVSFTGWRSELLNEKFKGMTVNNWFNQEEKLLLSPGDDMPWIAYGFGAKDLTVDWPSQGRNYFTNLEISRRGFNGGVRGAYGHGECDVIASALPQLTTIRKNNSLPAFSNVASNADLPFPDVPEEIDFPLNNHFIWSTPHYKAGGVQEQIDELNRYEIVLASWKSNYMDPIGDDTADITPRRLQNFRIIPGEEYIVRNTAVNDTAMVYQIDTITADEYGLVTFPGFQVKSGDQDTGGSRFVMIPLDPVSRAAARPLKEDNVHLIVSPNPFSSSVHIQLSKNKEECVSEKICIYTVTGKLVYSFLNPSSTPSTVCWNAYAQPVGIYMIKAKINGRILVQRMICLK